MRVGYVNNRLRVAPIALLIVLLCGPACASSASAVDLLDKAVASHRVIVLGEMHGTEEIPALVGTLLERRVAHGRREVLALEIDSAEQPRLDRYLESDGSIAARKRLLTGQHWTEPHHDGRDSAAMLALIERMRRLRAAGHAVPVVAFDRQGPHERDRDMADCLRATAGAFPGAQLVVLTGNVHAMTRRPPWAMNDGNGKPIEPPMSVGRYLVDLHPLSIDIDARKGAYWVCVDGGCRHQAVHRSKGPAPAMEPHSTAESAWDATLLIPVFTPSPPAVSVR